MREPRLSIVKTLSKSVRVLSVEQIGEHFFNESHNARARAFEAISSLTSLGYVANRQVTAKQLGATSGAFFSSPSFDTSLPDFKSLAIKNRRRWKGATLTTVITPRERALNRFGGNARVLRTREIEHDLRVSDVWFSLSKHNQERWCIEDEMDKRLFGSRRPDGALLGETSTTVIEVIGQGYSAAKISSIYSHFNRFNLEFY